MNKEFIPWEESMENLQKDIEKRRQMFHWYIDGIGFRITPDNHLHIFHSTGIDWNLYNSLTPDLVTEIYNVEFN